MPYGTIKVDTITFTDGGVDKSVAISGLAQNPTFTGNVTVTGTVSGATIRGTTVSGVTVTGTTANFASGVFTTQISGAIYVAPAGTAGAPSIQVGTGTTVVPGIYSSAIDQLAISTGNASRIIVDSVGQLRIIGAGSAGAPALITGNDLTTGLFSGGTGQLAFSTGGSERLRVDASGRLLVGTSSNYGGYKVQISDSNPIDAVRWAGALTGGPTCRLAKSRSAVPGVYSSVSATDTLGTLVFSGDDGAAFQVGASLSAAVDGTPGANDMPGRLIFSTTPSGSATPVERLRISSNGNISIGTATSTGNKVLIQASGDGSTSYHCLRVAPVFSSTATTYAAGYQTAIDIEDAAWTLPNLDHYVANQSAFGAATVTSQFGFKVNSSLTGATNNYGFYSTIPSGTGRWNFYANGTADSYFASNNFIFANGGTEKARVDSSGRLLVGTSSTRTVGGNFGATTNQILFETVDIASFTAVGNKADPSGPQLVLGKSRSGTIGGVTAVQNNDNLGIIRFAGANGTDLTNLAAEIRVEVDGEPFTAGDLTDLPGRLMFYTTADGSSSPTERMRIDNGGRIGVGGQVGTDTAFGLFGTARGPGTGNYGYRNLLTIPSTTTGSYIGYESTPATSAAAFTLASLQHYAAVQGTFGVGSTVTSQYGFVVSSTLVGATNNYGFYGDIASGTGRWNFYANGTAQNYFAGKVLFGTTTAANTGTLTVNGDISLYTGGTTVGRQGTYALGVSDSGTTGQKAQIAFAGTGTNGFLTNIVFSNFNGDFFNSGLVERARIDSSGRLLVGTSAQINGVFGNSAAVQFTTTTGTQALALSRFTANAFSADVDFLKSRNTTVGQHTIVQVNDQLGNLNFGGSDGTQFLAAASIAAGVDGTPGLNDMPGRLVFSTTADGASSPTERMRIDNAGRVGIAATPFAGVRLLVGGTTPGSLSNTAYAIDTDYTIQSDVTTANYSFLSYPSTAAAAFTLTSLFHYQASFNTLGAGSSITNQTGFRVDASMSTASNNYGFFCGAIAPSGSNAAYGFYSNIASGTNRWNFYANGTAQNYFAGNVGIGVTGPNYALDVASSDTTAGIGYALRLRQNATAGAAALQFTDSSATTQYGYIACDSSSNIKFATGLTEKARIDSSGRLLVGTTATLDTNYGTTGGSIQVTNTPLPVIFAAYTNDVFGGRLDFVKSRSTTTNGKTIVQNGDALGSLIFGGADGAAIIPSVTIGALVDGAPGLNDMPGRFVVSITGDGGSTPVEQWRINNGGTVIYNQFAPAAVDTTATLSVANLTAKIITSSTAAAVTMTLPLGTTMDGGFSGLYVNMSFEWSVINTGATNAVTVQANTGHTIVGSATVAASNSGRFLSRRTAANTWVTYRLSS